MVTRPAKITSNRRKAAFAFDMRCEEIKLLVNNDEVMNVGDGERFAFYSEVPVERVIGGCSGATKIKRSSFE